MSYPPTELPTAGTSAFLDRMSAYFCDVFSGMAFLRPSILAAFHDMVKLKRMELLIQKSDACG